jgi:hypothetical protein
MLPTLTWEDGVAARIRQMPLLVDELHALNGTRNPDTQTGAMQRHPQGGSKAPTNETVLFLLDERENSTWGGLHHLANISRTLWCALPEHIRSGQPQPHGLTWATETEWLADLWTAHATDLPELAIDYVITQTRILYTALASSVGIHEPHPAPCPRCTGPLDLVGPVMRCPRCGAEYPGPKALKTHWLTHDPMTTKDISNSLPGLTPEMLWQWKRRGKITPAGTAGKAHTWLPWDVIAVLWPDIAEAITSNDPEVVS